MKSLKYLLAFAAVLFLAKDMYAQPNSRYFYAGVSLGATNYKGDLDDNFTLKFTKPGLGFVGGYDPRKNFDGLLGALERIPKAMTAYNGTDKKQLVFFSTVGLGDGTDANIGHLQELPDPVARTSWGDYVMVCPKTFNRSAPYNLT